MGYFLSYDALVSPALRPIHMQVERRLAGRQLREPATPPRVLSRETDNQLSDLTANRRAPGSKRVTSNASPPA
jgi:hypothetical protein